MHTIVVEFITSVKHFCLLGVARHLYVLANWICSFIKHFGVTILTMSIMVSLLLHKTEAAKAEC